MIRKTFLLICIFCMTCPAILFAETVTLELNANTEDVEGKAEFKLQQYEADVALGGGVLFSKDDFLISNVSISVRDDMFTPALTLGLGFKGTYGRKEIEHSDDDFNASAIGFLFLGEFDFREVDTKIPLSIATNVSFSPDPLSFMDIDQYMDFMVALYVHIVKNAAVVVGYRYIEMKIDTDPGEVTSDYDSAYFGCRISF